MKKPTLFGFAVLSAIMATSCSVDKVKDSFLSGCTKETSIPVLSSSIDASMCTTNQTEESCDLMGGTYGKCKADPDKICEGTLNDVYYYTHEAILAEDIPCLTL
ncbi:MAG: hypothetical protein FWC15_04490 [Fibromonadales bacterium]|nr:hypothetical protein [Fibromonadales bacterium]